MSKAFTKEDGGETVEALPELAPWPAGVKNYLTAEGHARLKQEIESLRAVDGNDGRTRAQREARLQALLSRLEAAEVVTSPGGAGDDEPVRFGAWVTFVGDDESERRVRIVGVDEADGRTLISWRAPLARALLGKRPGDSTTVRKPGGDEEVQIVAVSWDGGG